MIRSLNDVLTTNLSAADYNNILNNPELQAEKFILALKVLLNTENVDVGFYILKNIEKLDTSVVIDPSFIEDLLNPENSKTLSFSSTLKLLHIILKNTQQSDIFEMAIHQNLSPYTQKAQPDSSNLNDVILYINLIIDHLNTQKMTTEFLQTCCSMLIHLISQISPEREPERIKMQQIDKSKIIDFFRSLKDWPQVDTESVHTAILNKVYEKISGDEPVTPLTSLGLIVIPAYNIGNSVNSLMHTTQLYGNQKKQIVNIVNRLVSWIRSVGMSVPLHIWAKHVLFTLHLENQHEIISQIVRDSFVPCMLTMILPLYQRMSSIVVITMLEIHKSERLLRTISNSAMINVLKRLEATNETLFNEMIDAYADFISFFPRAEEICRMDVEYLASHQRFLQNSIKQRRLSSTSDYSYNYSGLFHENVKIGLRNLGNTCYINSVLQALFMVKSFCRDLLTLEQTDRQTEALQRIFAMLLFSESPVLDIREPMSFIRPPEFMPGLQHDSSEFMGSLLDKIHEANKKSSKESGNFAEETGIFQSNTGISLSNFKIKTEKFEPGEDSLLDKIHETNKISSKESGYFSEETGNTENSLSNSPIKTENFKSEETEEAKGMVDDSGIKMETPKVDEDMSEYPTEKIVDNTSELNESTIVQRNFGGKITTTCVCDSCKSKSTSIDSFRDLALSFPEKDTDNEYSVQQLLDFYFTTEKLTLDGDNQYHCDKCKSLCDGDRHTELLQPPKNLILTLKHFRYDSRYHTRSKLLIKKMDHEERIAVKVRVGHDPKVFREVHYQLHSAVVHSGISLDSGHYYTFARNKNEWFKFNDQSVYNSSIHELLKLRSPDTPYILFYQRISTASSTASSASCSSLMQGNEDEFPNFDELPFKLRKHVEEENMKYEMKLKPRFPHIKTEPNQKWNDDDPPSSCGSNFGLEPNRYIY